MEGIARLRIDIDHGTVHKLTTHLGFQHRRVELGIGRLYATFERVHLCQICEFKRSRRLPPLVRSRSAQIRGV